MKVGVNKNDVIIDTRRDELLSEQGAELIRKHYMKEGDVSPQDAFARTAARYATDLDHAQRLYDAVSQLHFMYASPVLSNSGENDRGLPISCFLSHVPDTIDGLIYHEDETKWLSIFGGGVGGHWGSSSEKAVVGGCKRPETMLSICEITPAVEPHRPHTA